MKVLDNVATPATLRYGAKAWRDAHALILEAIQAMPGLDFSRKLDEGGFDAALRGYLMMQDLACFVSKEAKRLEDEGDRLGDTPDQLRGTK